MTKRAKKQPTERELDVLRLLASGLQKKEVALLLGISPGTVWTHRRNLHRRMGLHNFLDMQSLAIRLRVISCPCSQIEGYQR